jgi:hypothetical protein
VLFEKFMAIVLSETPWVAKLWLQDADEQRWLAGRCYGGRDIRVESHSTWYDIVGMSLTYRLSRKGKVFQPEPR